MKEKSALTPEEEALAAEWREVRNDLVNMFKERHLDFHKAAERYEVELLHEDDFDYEFNYERVKKFWKKPPKPDASAEELKDDHPEKARLPRALEYLKAVHTYLLEEGGLVVGKKDNDSKRRLIKNVGVDLWNEFHTQVIKRVEREEADEKWQ